MKKLTVVFALGFLMVMLQCTSSIALATEESGENGLAGIEYASVVQARDQLFFLGEKLYTYNVADGHLTKGREESIETFCPESKAEDLILVNGGSELHALDTANGRLYSLGEGERGLFRQLESDIFKEEADPFETRRFVMPTLTWADDREMLYLLVSNKDRPTEYELFYFDLASGGSGRVHVDNVILITNYKDGKMAAVIERTDAYRVVEINIATHEVGKTLYEEENPRYRITGIAYDQSSDKLIVVTGKGIYRIADQKMIDLYAYLPEMNERIIREDFNCFLNGKYVFINQSVFFTSDLNGESALKSLRFANNGVSNQSVRDFMRQNPDVKVSFSPDMVWNSKEIVDSLLTQNSDIDIITLYAGAGLSAMKNKKYYTNLSGSKELAEDIALMYPQIQDILMDGENLIAYPDRMMVYCWLVDNHALQQMGYDMENSTMKEWLDFVEEYARNFSTDESTYALFPQGFTKKQLVREILTQYIIEYESIGQLNFNDPGLKELLERATQLPKSIFLESDTDGAPIDAYDNGLPPLFIVNALLSPDEYIGFYEQYAPQYVAPPVFSTQNTPTVRGTLSVYLVNPYSKNQETAIEFIEYCAQHTDPLLRFYVEQSYDRPIPNQEFVDFKKKTTTSIEDLTNRLEKAKPEDISDIKAEIERQKIILAYAAKQEWLISDADITAYKHIAPGLTFLPSSLCFTDSSYSVTNINLNEILDMLLEKNFSVGQILAEADRKYNMIRMEDK